MSERGSKGSRRYLEALEHRAQYLERRLAEGAKGRRGASYDRRELGALRWALGQLHKPQPSVEGPDEHGCLYLTFREGPVRSTKRVPAEVFVDLDEEGNPLGIEMLGVALPKKEAAHGTVREL